ncbi:ion transporter [Brumimicrobium aurantiacum]|uniref:Ion transporter n=1 Tax=Brumimicrobium aurantiacum TaxID=1737063 RepID=A0A3E1EXZ5_9FLAO|nr:ion transporter [Brumimicrobium aurantiacum]RFC54407.1 ion transporter [Brumimicrobium aurantiacum]
MRKELREIINDNTTKKGKIFDYTIQILIMISLSAYAIETLPDLSNQIYDTLFWIEIVCLIVFVIEYILRLYTAKHPLKYIFSFYGIIDFLAIIPFFFMSTTGFMSLRAFRIFRVFRAFKLIRYNKALNRFHLVAKLIREEVILFLIVTGIFLFLASAGIYYFENKAQPEEFKSIFHSAWWAVVTLTTVGYGDIYPITAGGKFFTFFILMMGVGIVTIPAGLVASALTKAREMEEEAFLKDTEEKSKMDEKNVLKKGKQDNKS